MYLYCVDVISKTTGAEAYSAIVLANGSAQAKRDVIANRPHPSVDSGQVRHPLVADQYELLAHRRLEVEQLGFDAKDHGIILLAALRV